MLFIRPFQWASSASNLCLLHLVGDNAKTNGLMGQIAAADPDVPTNCAVSCHSVREKANDHHVFRACHHAFPKVLQHWCNAHEVHHVSESGWGTHSIINQMFCASQVIHAGHKFLVLLEHIRHVFMQELIVSYDWPSTSAMHQHSRDMIALLLSSGMLTFYFG